MAAIKATQKDHIEINKMRSRGLGDSIEKITSATGIKSLVKKVAGEDCGCKKRQDLLNKKFPYKPKYDNV